MFTVDNFGSVAIAVSVDGVQGSIAPGQSQLVSTWDFQGLTAPVDNPDVLNIVKAGQRVPLRWRLIAADGTPVTTLTTASIKATSLECGLGSSADQVEEVVTGSSGLLNLGNGYYQLNWKSPKAYANSCKTLELDLAEGVTHRALFRFTK